jgi:hypothetical protein
MTGHALERSITFYKDASGELPVSARYKLSWWVRSVVAISFGMIWRYTTVRVNRPPRADMSIEIIIIV